MDARDFDELLRSVVEIVWADCQLGVHSLRTGGGGVSTASKCGRVERGAPGREAAPYRGMLLTSAFALTPFFQRLCSLLTKEAALCAVKISWSRFAR